MARRREEYTRRAANVIEDTRGRVGQMIEDVVCTARYFPVELEK